MDLSTVTLAVGQQASLTRIVNLYMIDQNHFYGLVVRTGSIALEKCFFLTSFNWYCGPCGEWMYNMMGPITCISIKLTQDQCVTRLSIDIHYKFNSLATL